MSIHLKVSNSLEQLSLEISANLSSLQNNPFSKTYIVTQTEGINNWLKLSIAKQLGIAANIRFCKINDIISLVSMACGIGNKGLLDQEIMKWTIYELLEEEQFVAKFPETSSYYHDNPIKKIALASELADLFEQYQVYRYKTIETWNTHIDNLSSIVDWQEYLWRRLKQTCGELFEDKSEIGLKLIESLKVTDNQINVKNRIPAIHIFGMAIIAPYHLGLLNEISKSTDIYLYITNPAPEEYWLDDMSESQIAKLLQKKPKTPVEGLIQGNDLLLNWGTIAKTTFSLLYGEDDFVNSLEVNLWETNQDKNTLLHKIQSDILHNIPVQESGNYHIDDIKDGSITINGCYSALREVEVLYNYIIELIDKKKVAISPRDIVIMVSDIDLYAPYIHAVFGNGPHYIHYTIADETITAGNNMFSAITSILNLDAITFKAETVLELLDSNYIKKRFRFNDISAVRNVVRQAGIYYGIDNHTEDETYMVSWNYGLKKILYGLCIGGSPTDFSDGKQTFIPLDSAEGAEGAERIKLMYFIKSLQHFLELRNTEKTIGEWALYLQELLENMVFESGVQDDEDFPRFVSFIDKLVMLDKTTQDIKISFEVFRYSFLQQLTAETKSSSFSGSGITFCSLVPMRSVPFKIVGMLGMDFDKFPRKEKPLSFSILQREKLKGDRNIKENDKHLFLENLLSAKEFLYISYIGKSSKDGTAIPPSSMVDELIGYVANALKIEGDALSKKWVTAHPLHGFSKRYFESGGLINYLSEDCYKTDLRVLELAKVPDELNYEEIKIQDLVSFFQNPPKYYLNKRLGVYYRAEEEMIPEHEVFEFDKLTEWGIKNELLYVEEDKVEEELRIKKLNGEMPLANMGSALVEELKLELNELKLIYQGLVNDKTQVPKDIDLTIDNSKIKGRIEEIFDDSYIYVCNSSDFSKHVIGAYIKFLLLKVQGFEINLHFINKKDLQIYSVRAITIDKEKAEAQLKLLIGYYKMGLKDYFRFYPVLLLPKKLPDNYEEFIAKYEDALENDRNYDFGDPYLQKAVENGFFKESCFDELEGNVKSILGMIPESFMELFS